MDVFSWALTLEVCSYRKSSFHEGEKVGDKEHTACLSASTLFEPFLEIEGMLITPLILELRIWDL